MAAFLFLGGPAFLTAFALGLFFRRRFLLLLGVLMLAAVLVWLAFEPVDPLAATEDIRRLIAFMWFVGWLLGLAVAGLARGTAWLYGVGADDR